MRISLCKKDDAKYGNRDGLTVFVLCKNDGDYDETFVQINLNIRNGKTAFMYNVSVTRKVVLYLETVTKN